MKTLMKLQDKVLEVLVRFPSTRDNDKLLYGAVLAHYYNIPLGSTSVREVLLNDKLPSLESIGRIRRKIQAEHEDLRGTKAKEKVRLNAQADYIEYANEGRM